MKALLLGPGYERGRLPAGSKPFGTDPEEQLTVIDYDPAVLEFWQASRCCCMEADLSDLGQLVLQGLAGDFDEVHAYEILNLLPGTATEFFRLWRFIYDVLKPGGKVWATVPHWESQWIHAYPAPQRTYTPGLLGYLNQDSKNSAQEHFDSLWPRPYDFKLEDSWIASAPDPETRTMRPQGWHFCLVKAVAPPEAKA